MNNLLGAFVLIAGERVQSASDTGTGRPATDTAALMLLATTLDGISQEGLARPLGLTQSGATRLVDRLVRDGLVRRQPGPDRRTFADQITPTGRRSARAGLNTRTAACADLLQPLDASERQLLTLMLEKLLHALPTSPPEAHRICRLCDPIACGHHQGACPVTLGLEAHEQDRATTPHGDRRPAVKAPQ